MNSEEQICFLLLSRNTNEEINSYCFSLLKTEAGSSVLLHQKQGMPSTAARLAAHTHEFNSVLDFCSRPTFQKEGKARSVLFRESLHDCSKYVQTSVSPQTVSSILCSTYMQCNTQQVLERNITRQFWSCCLRWGKNCLNGLLRVYTH